MEFERYEDDGQERQDPSPDTSGSLSKVFGFLHRLEFKLPFSHHSRSNNDSNYNNTYKTYTNMFYDHTAKAWIHSTSSKADFGSPQMQDKIATQAG